MYSVISEYLTNPILPLAVYGFEYRDRHGSLQGVGAAIAFAKLIRKQQIEIEFITTQL